ncbi:uncharacterized protein ACN427_007146 isoform 1-T1 [Glossina fuscipes fuscipes]
MPQMNFCNHFITFKGQNILPHTYSISRFRQFYDAGRQISDATSIIIPILKPCFLTWIKRSGIGFIRIDQYTYQVLTIQYYSDADTYHFSKESLQIEVRVCSAYMFYIDVLFASFVQKLS